MRKITRNMHGYPTKPMWAAAIDGGLGIQSLLDYVHKSKLRILLRNINKSDKTGEAFEGFISRSLRSAGTGGLQCREQTILSHLDKSTWMSSLISWLSRMDLVIIVQGDPSPSLQSDLTSGDIPGRHELFGRGIALVGEESLDPLPTSIQLRAGQCWVSNNKVLEIVGFTPQGAQYLE